MRWFNGYSIEWLHFLKCLHSVETLNCYSKTGNHLLHKEKMFRYSKKKCEVFFGSWWIKDQWDAWEGLCFILQKLFVPLRCGSAVGFFGLLSMKWLVRERDFTGKGETLPTFGNFCFMQVSLADGWLLSFQQEATWGSLLGPQICSHHTTHLFIKIFYFKKMLYIDGSSAASFSLPYSHLSIKQISLMLEAVPV